MARDSPKLRHVKNSVNTTNLSGVALRTSKRTGNLTRALSEGEFIYDCWIGRELSRALSSSSIRGEKFGIGSEENLREHIRSRVRLASSHARRRIEPRNHPHARTREKKARLRKKLQLLHYFFISRSRRTVPGPRWRLNFPSSGTQLFQYRIVARNRFSTSRTFSRWHGGFS